MRALGLAVIFSYILFPFSSIAKVAPLGCVDCFNFVAPSVIGAGNISPAEVGLIVYDSDVNMFRGYTNNGNWSKLSTESSIKSVTAAYTLLSTDDTVLADASGGAFTLTLPAAASNTGKTYSIITTSSTTNKVTVDANASETINGVVDINVVGLNSYINVLSDGTNWRITSRDNNPKVQARGTTGATYAATTEKVIVYNTEDLDVSGSYNNSTGVFTLSKNPGTYRVSATIFVSSSSSLAVTQGVHLRVRKNGVAFKNGLATGNGSGTSYSADVTADIELSGSDTVDIALWSEKSGTISTSTGFCHLSIHRVGD